MCPTKSLFLHHVSTLSKFSAPLRYTLKFLTIWLISLTQQTILELRNQILQKISSMCSVPLKFSCLSSLSTGTYNSFKAN